MASQWSTWSAPSPYDALLWDERERLFRRRIANLEAQLSSEAAATTAPGDDTHRSHTGTDADLPRSTVVYPASEHAEGRNDGWGDASLAAVEQERVRGEKGPLRFDCGTMTDQRLAHAEAAHAADALIAQQRATIDALTDEVARLRVACAGQAADSVEAGIAGRYTTTAAASTLHRQLTSPGDVVPSLAALHRHAASPDPGRQGRQHVAASPHSHMTLREVTAALAGTR